MAKRRKGASHTGEGHYQRTQFNLDRKGKTNKKLRRNPQASKYLTSRSQEIMEAAKAYAAAHPKGSGRRYQNKKQQIMDKVEAAS